MKITYRTRISGMFGALMLFASVTSAANISADLAKEVNPLIGTSNLGNTFPGPVMPFGMFSFSPEMSKGEKNKAAAPGGYLYEAKRIRGFSLAHLSGTGCRGASGDVPFMPITSELKTSPALDSKDETYASRYSHINEKAQVGYYQVRMENGVDTELSASLRAGIARFSYPRNGKAGLLIRNSDSQVGSFDAELTIDPSTNTVSGSVSSGNFCGYLNPVTRRAYYKIHFVARFDQAFAATATWVDEVVTKGGLQARGGTGIDSKGFPNLNKGSGAYLDFGDVRQVHARVAISYVSIANAHANLAAEMPQDKSLEKAISENRQAWNSQLGKIKVQGGSADQRTIFYTALYHSLLHPNLFSDVNGQYAGFDQKTHQVQAPQVAQYANFSGWDVYRSQVQLLTLIEPKIASDIAQSLLNQANQNQGVWDRWTHNNGATGVMNGDPSAAAVASIYAFGGRDFASQAAFDSLSKAARVPTKLDLSTEGCPIMCVGQRPGLDQWIKLGYMPKGAPGWGMVSDALEYASADFGLASFAGKLGDTKSEHEFLARAQNWKRHFNPASGYLQERKLDGSFTPNFNPDSDEGMVEGSGAQYLWMVPFNAAGLIKTLGGNATTTERLDKFFHTDQGRWALTVTGGNHSEMDNEPSVGAAWIYNFAGQPWKTQQVVREVVNTLWANAPGGIPGNDDLGQMSAWYVWAAMGLYPNYPGRAELLIASPLFSRIDISRPVGNLVIQSQGAHANRPYIKGLIVNGRPSNRAWLPEAFLNGPGHLMFQLSHKPVESWATKASDAPPSFDLP